MRKYLTLSLCLVSLLAVSTTAQSKERWKTDTIKVGETTPDFSLRDETGKTYTLSKPGPPTVIVFYRGYW